MDNEVICPNSRAPGIDERVPLQEVAGAAQQPEWHHVEACATDDVDSAPTWEQHFDEATGRWYWWESVQQISVWADDPVEQMNT